MKHRLLFLFSFLCTLFFNAQGASEKYRLMWRDDPSTTICVGWVQNGGGTATVYYDTTDHGGNLAAFQYSHGVDRSVNHKGMAHRFSRISGLQPNTAYYFYIEDSDGSSQVFWFKTVPDDSYETLSIIAGGDSRNNRVPRQKANYLVSRMRPHAVFFGGDMTDGSTNTQWQNWLDDWQLTIGSDGRMIPIIAARGNHESSNADIINIFDTPGGDVYYALNFGGDLLRAYTLNSLIFAGGSQSSWLSNDLALNTQSIWKIAQYHFPTRPHVSSKLDNALQYASWAQIFYNYNVELAIECDAHCVKTTWPIVPDTGPQSDEGFKRDDINGTVYVGEGCWGAPTRAANDTKSWTRASGRFNQFKWILIDRYQIEVRTVKTDNAYSVGLIDDSDICSPPANLDVWDMGNGDEVVVIENPALTAPGINLIAPENELFYVDRYPVKIEAAVQDNNGVGIQKVDFFIDGQLEHTDQSAPYSFQWVPPAFGEYAIQAKVRDYFGEFKKSESRFISVGEREVTQNFFSNDGDAEELLYNNSMDLNSQVLEIPNAGNNSQKVGLRFSGINLPKSARLIDSRLIFTAHSVNNAPATINIKTEKKVNAAPFSNSSFDIYFRQLSTATVNWTPAGWTQAGNTYTSPNLNSIISEVQNKSGWNENSPLVFILSGTGTREAVSFDQNPVKAPKLLLKYDFGPNAAPELGPDRNICNDTSVILNGGSDFNIYEWNNRAALDDSVLQVNTAGLNYVWTRSGPNNKVVGFDSVRVNIDLAPQLNLMSDVGICPGDSVQLSVAPNYTAYEWSNGAQQNFITVDQPGVYTLTVSQGSCTTIDTTEVYTFPTENISLPVDTQLAGATIILNATAPAFVNYQWSTGATASEIEISDPGIYSLTVTDTNNCVYHKDIFVKADSLISSIETLGFKADIYPNPFTDQLFIQTDAELSKQIEEIGIYTANGKVLKSLAQFSAQNIALDLSDLNYGVYFIVIRTKTGHLSKRIVKL